MVGSYQCYCFCLQLIVNDPEEEHHIVIDYNDLISNVNEQVERVYNFRDTKL